MHAPGASPAQAPTPLGRRLSPLHPPARDLHLSSPYSNWRNSTSVAVHSPLLWIAIAVAATYAPVPVNALQNWLGSASPGIWDGAHTWSPPFWDAAAFWGASAMIATLLLATAPEFARGLWQWSNTGSFGLGIVWFHIPLYSVAVGIGLVPFVIAWAALWLAIRFASILIGQ
jgi:hypothetical protein